MCAICAMLVTLGESLTMRGRRAARRGRDDFIEGPGIAAELQASLRRVGAGDVEFVGGDAFAVIENLDGAFVVFASVAEYVGNDDGVFYLAEFGQLLFQKSRGTDVLQADGVEHSGGSFPEAWRRVADHGLAREAFDDESAELVEMDYVFELDAVAEGSAGGDDGVLELDSGEGDA
jgi:hypothetical protein